MVVAVVVRDETFRDRETAGLFSGERVGRLPPDIRQVARRKLAVLEAASRVEELRVPPGNRLEPLHGDRQGPVEHPHQCSVASLLPV